VSKRFLRRPRALSHPGPQGPRGFAFDREARRGRNPAPSWKVHSVLIDALKPEPRHFSHNMWVAWSDSSSNHKNRCVSYLLSQPERLDRAPLRSSPVARGASTVSRSRRSARYDVASQSNAGGATAARGSGTTQATPRRSVRAPSGPRGRHPHCRMWRPSLLCPRRSVQVTSGFRFGPIRRARPDADLTSVRGLELPDLGVPSSAVSRCPCQRSPLGGQSSRTFIAGLGGLARRAMDRAFRIS
jgi:hypothetical protein